MKWNDMKWSSQTEKCTKRYPKMHQGSINTCVAAILHFCNGATGRATVGWMLQDLSTPPICLLKGRLWEELKTTSNGFRMATKKRAGYTKRHCKPVPRLSNFQRITTHWVSGTQEEKPLWKSLGKEKTGINLPQTPANVLRCSKIFCLSVSVFLRHFATF